MSSIVEAAPAAPPASPTAVDDAKVVEVPSRIGLTDSQALDRIAEAEELAAEALRMANEAKRAAERLAEVKARLAKFSRKIETANDVKKIYVVETDVVVDAPTTKENDAPTATSKDVSVVAKSTAVTTLAPPKPTVVVPNVAEKDVLESMLDSMGFDTACGIEDDAIMEALASNEGFSVKKTTSAPSPKSIVAAAPAKVTTPSPVTTLAPPKKTIVVASNVAEKDMLESVLDSFGVDRACGIDDDAVVAALASNQSIYVSAAAPEKTTTAPSPKPVVAATPAAPTPVYQLAPESLPIEDEIEKDIVERFFDLTVGEPCGVTDAQLGLARPNNSEPAPVVHKMVGDVIDNIISCDPLMIEVEAPAEADAPVEVENPKEAERAAPEQPEEEMIEEKEVEETVAVEEKESFPTDPEGEKDDDSIYADADTDADAVEEQHVEEEEKPTEEASSPAPVVEEKKAVEQDPKIAAELARQAELLRQIDQHTGCM
eukprot:CAMPEP_0113489168 /NCGR_PEP_ID=MMETSP0014_2-20120614/26391_1 /TAXON_ID=2857 /ORGANISM="Nitzschia sp." /LENGTH=486 /DNA_ID=CAMNT_0000382899 /DNA_START=42 /DNA_END=1502 /DNA_ORIENTATION=+ /assembly_acc=CAM_ASM_000159